MRILYLVGREHTYPRNDVLLRAFRRLGMVKVTRDGGARSLLLRSVNVLLHAVPHLLTGNFDLVFVGFYGHLLMLPVGVLARVPILFDAFVSSYDTLCFDRQVFAPHSLPGHFAFWLDQTACRLASMVLVDTQLQANYFTSTFGLAHAKVYHVPVGCNEDIFFPQSARTHDNAVSILYYSTYQPLHGVETVVQAAALLRSESQFRFRLIGTGPDYGRVRCLADNLRAQNIAFQEYVPLTNLPAEIAAAGICLGGPFGHTGKASRVMPGKIFQILAMGRPLIAADTPANRELLAHEETAYLCLPDSPESLASAILTLYRDAALCEHLAIAGRALYLEKCSEAVITEQLRKLIGEMIG